VKRHPSNDADFLVKDPSVTQKVAAKADRSSDPFDYIDELRQESLDAATRDYRIWNEVKALKQSMHDLTERLGDTGLNEIIDERVIGRVRNTATRWGTIFLRRTLIATGAIVATGIAGAIAWILKLAWKGLNVK
jgi:hypothetical protein